MTLIAKTENYYLLSFVSPRNYLVSVYDFEGLARCHSRAHNLDSCVVSGNFKTLSQLTPTLSLQKTHFSKLIPDCKKRIEKS